MRTGNIYFLDFDLTSPQKRGMFMSVERATSQDINNHDDDDDDDDI